MIIHLPTLVLFFADVAYQACILFSLQNLEICSSVTATDTSHLFARSTIGMLEPSGSVTFSLRSFSHFFIDWKVAAREMSNTRAAATLRAGQIDESARSVNLKKNQIITNKKIVRIFRLIGQGI